MEFLVRRSMSDDKTEDKPCIYDITLVPLFVYSGIGFLG